MQKLYFFAAEFALASTTMSMINSNRIFYTLQA